MFDIDRLKKSYYVFKIIARLLQSEELTFSYKSLLSDLCSIHAWQQKYEPYLKRLGIISKARHGNYTLNANQLYYVLYNIIMEDEKAETIRLLNKHKKCTLD